MPCLHVLIAACCSILILGACGCKPDQPEPTLQLPDFSNQYWSDDGINPVARWGTGPITSYQQESWDNREKALFLPLDTAVLPATPWQDSMVAESWFYPNPAVSTQTLSWRQAGPVNLKVVLINRAMTPLRSFSATSGSTPFYNMQLSYDGLDLSADSLYRLYYAFSTADHPFFRTAHADITIYH